MGLHHLYGDHADHGSHLPRGASRRRAATSPWGNFQPGSLRPASPALDNAPGSLRPAPPAPDNAPGRKRRLKGFLVRKDGHVFAFVYPPEHEGVALAALSRCPTLDPVEVLALACYLGHDPHALGLDELA